MRIAFFLSLFMLFVSDSLLRPESSKADNHVCNGTIGAVAVENLRVTKGSFCKLQGTRVQGNLFVGANATLVASEVQVSGNLQARHAAQVNVTFFSRIDGNIQIQQSQGATISASRINGNVQFVSNTGYVSARGNEIRGNLEVFQNLGGVLIRNNRINGNLTCQSNQPNPTGNDNAVQGNQENQCSRL
jgi:hypothetical protein